MRFIYLCILCLAFGNMELLAKEQIAKPEHFEIFKDKLANGLRIIFMPTDSNGIIHLGVLYDVGSADDPLCQIGLSHFLEHMMFKGTRRLSGERLKYMLDKYNAYSNAYTEYDFTLFRHTVKSEFLDLDLEIEADRMKNLLIKDSDIEQERKVVMEERKLRYESNPLHKNIIDAIPQMLFLYSTYSYPVSGYPQHIRQYDKQSVLSHYKKYYNPNNATIIVVGNIQNCNNQESYNKIVSKINDKFGSIQNESPIPSRQNRIEDPLDTGIKYVLDRSIPEAKTRNLTITYSFDKRYISSIKEYVVLNLLLKIMFGPSVIYKLIVDEKNLVYDIDVLLNTPKYSKKYFVFIQMTLREKISRKDVENELLRIINTFNKEYLTNELFDKNKRLLLNQYYLSFDDPSQLFSLILTCLYVGGSIDDIRNIKQIIDSITVDDIREMCQKIFKNDHITHKIYSHPKNVEPEAIIKY